MAWCTGVPKADKKQTLTLLRTPAKGKTGGIITSHDVIGTDTHYWGGRTVKCEDDTCEACAAGIGKRWHGYVGVYNPSLHKHFIFEFTQGAGEPFARHIELTKTLRGCAFKAERNGRRPNSPVLITTWPANLDGVALPDPPDIVAIMSMIWGVPATSLKATGRKEYAKKLVLDGELMDKVNGPTKDREARRRQTA